MGTGRQRRRGGIRQRIGGPLRGPGTCWRIRFRGREIHHPEVARELLQRVATEVQDVTTIEAMPNMDGRSMIMVLAPA